MEEVLNKYGIVIGYHFPMFTPPIKFAGTDEESRRKLKEMLSLVQNSKHEWQLYKDLEKSIDVDIVKLEGPKPTQHQNFKLHDFRKNWSNHINTVRHQHDRLDLDQIHLDLSSEISRATDMGMQNSPRTYEVSSSDVDSNSYDESISSPQNSEPVENPDISMSNPDLFDLAIPDLSSQQKAMFLTATKSKFSK